MRKAPIDTRSRYNRLDLRRKLINDTLKQAHQAKTPRPDYPEPEPEPMKRLN